MMKPMEKTRLGELDWPLAFKEAFEKNYPDLSDEVRIELGELSLTCDKGEVFARTLKMHPLTPGPALEVLAFAEGWISAFEVKWSKS